MSLLDLVPPQAKLILAGVVLSGLVAGGFYIHHAGYTAGQNDVQAKWDKEKLDSVREARSKEQHFNEQLQEAQNAATQREIALRTDSTNLRTQLDGLRKQLSDANGKLANATKASLIDRTVALQDVFQQCTERYSELAEKADRHASDARTLYEGWPVDTSQLH